MRAYYLWIWFAVIWAIPAQADSLAEARLQLASGQYQQALSTTDTLTSFEALMVRGEVLNSQLMLGAADDKKTAKQAMAIAYRARTTDPTSKEAQLLYATSYAFYGRTVSKLTAWRKRTPSKIRTEIDAALAMDPANPHIHALLGAWHLGVVHRAGTKTAKKHFGAERASGVEFFNRALSGAPNDILINANAGMMLLVSDPDAYSEKARLLLATAKTATPKDYLETQVQVKAVEILQHWDNQKSAYKLAEDFLDW